MSRAARILALGVLLAVVAGIPAAGQGDDEGGSLAALCEANEAMRESCLHLVATVLATAKAPTPWEEFETHMTEVLAPYSASNIRIEGVELDVVAISELRRGNWRPRDPETGRNLDLSRKKQVKRAQAVAGVAAAELREFLLSVTPDGCYEDVYSALWSLSTAWDYYSDGLGSVKRLVRPALEGFGQASQLTFCGPPTWHVDVAPPSTMS